MNFYEDETESSLTLLAISLGIVVTLILIVVTLEPAATGDRPVSDQSSGEFGKQYLKDAPEPRWNIYVVSAPDNHNASTGISLIPELPLKNAPLEGLITNQQANVSLLIFPAPN